MPVFITSPGQVAVQPHYRAGGDAPRLPGLAHLLTRPSWETWLRGSSRHDGQRHRLVAAIFKNVFVAHSLCPRPGKTTATFTNLPTLSFGNNNISMSCCQAVFVNLRVRREIQEESGKKAEISRLSTRSPVMGSTRVARRAGIQPARKRLSQKAPPIPMTTPMS